jgi:hypothetical protein
MITKALYGMMVASHAVGTPIVKGAKFLASKTPKGVKKFGKKAKKVIKTEYKEQKAYIVKKNPEMAAGSAAIGASLGLGINAFRKDKNKNKKKG